MAFGDRAMVPGIRNCSASFVLKMHGIGTETADEAQVPNTYLAKLRDIHWSYTPSARKGGRAPAC